MNKTLGIAIGVAMVVMPFIASAATFNTNLTVGSTGADVTALQGVLAEAGYLAVSPTGYFGNLTKAALAKWQAANVISPAVGYFGPITRAAFGGGSVAVATPGCPAGALFNSMTGQSCATTVVATPGCPAGALFSSVTGLSCTGGAVATTWAPDGTDGSISLSYVSYAPASQTLKKGDMNKPIISVKLQATNGKTAATRFDVHFSERPWLDFSSVSLTDSTGKILATKTLSSAADTTEITVGSDYLVRFDAISPIVVTPGTDVIVAVTANVLAASDKITGQTVYVSVPTGAVRTINGKSYTDSVGIGATSQGGALNVTYGNAVTLSTTGSTGALYTRISPTTPIQRIVVTSATQQTTNVVLGVFSLKVQNQNSTINSIGFNIPTGTSTASFATTSLFSNVRLSVGSLTYGANALTAGNTTFTNMSIPMVADQWTDVTLTADVASGYQGTNITASSTLVAASVVGVDSNYNTVSVTTASNVTSNDITFLNAGLNLINTSSTLGSILYGYGTSNGPSGYNVTAKFTLTNTGNSDVYIARTAGALVATSTYTSGTQAVGTASSTFSSLTVSPSTLAGDNTNVNAYVVPAGGSRDITLNGVLGNTGGTGHSNELRITGVYFNTTAASVVSTSTASSITYGLSGLQQLFSNF